MTDKEAGETVRGIIYSCIDQGDHVISMQTLFMTFVNELKAAYQQGWTDCIDAVIAGEQHGLELSGPAARHHRGICR
jgi:hypothetical protein